MSTKLKISRKLRKEGTDSEQRVWSEIRNRKFKGYKFRRQHVICGFIVDFYCPQLKLAIEVDGKVHGRQQEYDALRQEILEMEGIGFLRIKVEDIEKTSSILNAWIESRTYPKRRLSSVSPPLHAFKHGEGVGG